MMLMMGCRIRIRDIDFPSDLLAAQRDGKLVVFAGAGVSMGPPANYPDFNGLVRRIARGTEYRKANHEPIDHFLGRLEKNGAKVHQLTKSLLANPTSRPNALHASLVRMFASASALRLITTNFDMHFSTETERVFNAKAETFCAPALPVGNKFQGLVYLHGSVDGPAERLVLTDGDFGRAYLTEGWAKRFLLDLYANFVVLFIGYSHNDIVLQYLARGLTSNNTRRLFALTPAGNNSHWEFLGISPISYPLRDKPDAHGALSEAIKAWAELSSMGALEHEDRIKGILSGSPPLVGTEEDDYLRNAVEDEEQLHFFVRNATGTEWLFWAEKRGLLGPLFSRRTDDNRFRSLADWYAKEYVVKNPEEALGVFERQGQVLSQCLWYEIARNFHSHKDIEVTSLTKWLPILLDQASVEDNPSLLEYLFEKAAGTGSWPLVLRLFEHLTRPRVKFVKSLTFFNAGRRDKAPADGKVMILGSHHWLKNALDKILKPNMPELVEELARITSHSIRMAYNIGVLLDKAHSEWDGTSFQRPAIETHSQNDLKYDFDIVIDACRESLQWLFQHKHRTAKNHIDEWILAPAPLLRRIAVYGMCIDKRAGSGQKLKWAVKHELVASDAVHHELFQLLRVAYPTAGTNEKKAFLDQARTVTLRKIKHFPKRNPDMFWHSLFTLLSWLDHAVDGKCTIVRGQMRRLQRRYPSFRHSDHPDFTFWSSAVQRAGTESPISVDELNKMTIKTAVQLLETYKGEEFFSPNREGLLSVLSTTVTKKPDWGLGIAKEILKHRKINADIWKRLFLGWSEANLTGGNWQIILNMIDQNRKLTQHVYAIAQLLIKGTQKEQLPYALLPLAERICVCLWTEDSRKNRPQKADSSDWLQVAINETGGDLAEFFMIAISLRKKHAGTRWSGIPQRLKMQLQRIVTGKGYTAEMGRVLLVSQVHFLYSSDPSWSRKNIFPLLAWQRGKRHTTQAWHGYLAQGKWFDEFLPDLFPLYEKSFTRLNTDLQHVRQRFVMHMASICMFSSWQKARGLWLNHFLQSASPDNRKEFADVICKTLWELAPERAADIWHKWLNSYWVNRITGKPVPLDTEEASKMAEWAPHLGPVFPQVVDRIRETGIALSVDDFIYNILIEKKIPNTHPKATAELLSLLVPSSYNTVQDYGDLIKVLDKLVGYPETYVLLNPVINHMAAKGSLIASKYRDRISLK